jgi:hypothetical protein
MFDRPSDQQAKDETCGRHYQAGEQSPTEENEQK